MLRPTTERRKARIVGVLPAPVHRDLVSISSYEALPEIDSSVISIPSMCVNSSSSDLISVTSYEPSSASCDTFDLLSVTSFEAPSLNNNPSSTSCDTSLSSSQDASRCDLISVTSYEATKAGQVSSEDSSSVTSLERNTGDPFTVSFSFEDSLFNS